MALEGTIKDFGLPDIFQLIGLQRKTGILTLRRDKEQVTVTFESGLVVNADNDPKRTEDRLGSVLVKQGKLSAERLEEALAKQKATLQRVGHVLTANGYVSQKDLRDALQTQVSQAVFKLFRWTDGEYHFEPAEKVEFDRENFNPMSSDFILMEGVRMVDEWPIIEKKIPTTDIVFKSVVDASMIEGEGGGGDETDDAFAGIGELEKSSSKIRLTHDEERVYRKVDGSRTVQGIIDATGLGDFDTCRILFDLLNRNIVASVGRGSARAHEERQQAASPAVGYAMMGLAVALSLAGLALRWQAPFAVTGLPPLLKPSFDLVLDGVGRARVDRLDRAVRAFQLAHGALPKTLEEVVQDGLVDRSYLKDPKNRTYQYGPTDTGYIIQAVDAAGQPVAGTLVERVVPPPQP